MNLIRSWRVTRYDNYENGIIKGTQSKPLFPELPSPPVKYLDLIVTMATGDDNPEQWTTLANELRWVRWEFSYMSNKYLMHVDWIPYSKQRWVKATVSRVWGCNRGVRYGNEQLLYKMARATPGGGDGFFLKGQLLSPVFHHSWDMKVTTARELVGVDNLTRNDSSTRAGTIASYNPSANVSVPGTE